MFANAYYLCIACRMVQRSKIRKNRVFNKFKIMSKDKDIREWCDEENDITFAASDTYVEKLRRRLVTAHGCSVDPVISEA